MIESPFKPVELQKPSILNKILNTQPKQNIIAEINNFLVEKQVPDITSEMIIELESRYKIKLENKFIEEKKDLLSKYICHCFNSLDDLPSKKACINHLSSLLKLPQETALNIYEDQAAKYYTNIFAGTISNGRLTDQDIIEMDNLQNKIGLSTEMAEEITVAERTKFLKEFVKKITEDQRVSDEEDKELKAIIKSFNIELSLGKKAKISLEKYRSIWRIENKDLPVIEPDILLQRSEQCYHMVMIRWYELRAQSRRLRYGGPTARIKIAKGVYWRVGDVGYQTVSEEVMKYIDHGNLYVTNKRLIFVGKKGNKTIRFSNILNIEPSSNGLEIIKDSGKNPFFETAADVDILGAIILKAMSLTMG